MQGIQGNKRSDKTIHRIENGIRPNKEKQNLTRLNFALKSGKQFWAI